MINGIIKKCFKLRGLVIFNGCPVMKEFNLFSDNPIVMSDTSDTSGSGYDSESSSEDEVPKSRKHRHNKSESETESEPDVRDQFLLPSFKPKPIRYSLLYMKYNKNSFIILCLGRLFPPGPRKP